MLSLSVLVVVDGWIRRKKCSEIRGTLVLGVIYSVIDVTFGCSGSVGQIRWKIFEKESCYLST